MGQLFSFLLLISAFERCQSVTVQYGLRFIEGQSCCFVVFIPGNNPSQCCDNIWCVRKTGYCREMLFLACWCFPRAAWRCHSWFPSPQHVKKYCGNLHCSWDSPSMGFLQLRWKEGQARSLSAIFMEGSVSLSITCRFVPFLFWTFWILYNVLVFPWVSFFLNGFRKEPLRRPCTILILLFSRSWLLMKMQIGLKQNAPRKTSASSLHLNYFVLILSWMCTDVRTSSLPVSKPIWWQIT